MEQNKCQSCQHYKQHYVFFEHKLSMAYCGHCLVRRGRRLRPDSKTCEQFLLRAEDPLDDFVSKEYLYKELLRHVLEMELLPEIMK